MDYEKAKLTPEVETEPPKDAVEKAKSAQKKLDRKRTEQFKQKYFELYDDVKINHREDW